jgi:Phosphopantetheine attachment site
MSAPVPPMDQYLVQRDQLPLPRPYAAPRTPTEQRLSEIWCDVLSMDRVGIDDAYHDLGGDSFFATVIVEMIDESFQVGVPMGILIDSPTIREMAPKIDSLIQC